MLVEYCDECERVVSKVGRGSVYVPTVKILGPFNGEFCSLLCAKASIEKELTRRERK